MRHILISISTACGDWFRGRQALMSLTAWVLLLLLQCTTGARQLQQDFARVALCLAVRDERREDLREWVRYHLAIGVQRCSLFFFQQSKVSSKLYLIS